MSSFANELPDCCICMEVISDTNKTTTECGHTFHSSCIFKNLCQRIECPMCRKELVEPPPQAAAGFLFDDDDDDDDYDDDEDEYDDDEVESVLSINSFQFQSENEDGDEHPCAERYLEFKKYAHKRESDPVLSYQQIVDKMMQMGVTPADMMALYCVKIAEIHTETEEDTAKYCPKKIHELDILYRKIARGEIAVDYRDQRSYSAVLQSDKK
jgi:hypothetical protein